MREYVFSCGCRSEDGGTTKLYRCCQTHPEGRLLYLVIICRDCGREYLASKKAANSVRCKTCKKKYVKQRCLDQKDPIKRGPTIHGILSIKLPGSYSLQEIAEEIGVTKARVQQIVDIAMFKFLEKFRAWYPDTYKLFAESVDEIPNDSAAEPCAINERRDYV